MDLTTTYMGLELKNPLVASASPLSQSLANIKRMEDADAAAVVMFSLFEEQVEDEAEAARHLVSSGAEDGSEALSYFPDTGDYRVEPDEYLDLLHRAVESVDIPVIGSLNGVTDLGWIEYARKMEQAGAAAVELNIYFIPADPAMTGRKVEETYLDIVQAVKEVVHIPVAVKLSPFFSAMAHMAQQLDEAGADGLVLFNRFYQPDFDLNELEVRPTLNLSNPYEIRLPLMWIAILYGRLRCSLAATRGVHSGTEVLKYIMAGADVVMVASALLANGVDFLTQLLEETTVWMGRKGYDTLQQLKGSMSQRSVANPTAFERANYIKTLRSYQSPYAPPDIP